MFNRGDPRNGKKVDKKPHGRPDQNHDIKLENPLDETSGVGLVNQHAPDRQISVYEKDNPYSVYNRLPGNAIFIKGQMDNVPDKYREMDHYNLRNELKPSPTINQLRINFWTEYDMSVGENRFLRVNNIIAGVCSVPTFRSHCKDPKKLAWILTPVQSYQSGVQDILETCLHKMRLALDKADVKTTKDLNIVMKIYEAFDKRVHGEYAQKIQKEVTYRGVPRKGMDQIKEKMKELGIKNDNVVEYKEVENETRSKREQES